MGKGRSCLHFPSAAASRRALTWEGAAEAVPAQMSRCCLPKVSSSPYKVILKGKYFPTNLRGWSGSIFRPARACEGEPCLAFALICCLTENVPSLFHPGLWHGDAAPRRAGWEPGWRTQICVVVVGASRPSTSAQCRAYFCPLDFSKEVTALLA